MFTSLYLLFSPVAIASASPDADPYRYADAALGLDYVLLKDTLKDIDEDVRQIGFQLNLRDGLAEWGEMVAMHGTVQVNCKTQETRITENKGLDRSGAEVEIASLLAEASPQWSKLGDSDEDKHLARSLCGSTESTPE